MIEFGKEDFLKNLRQNFSMQNANEKRALASICLAYLLVVESKRKVIHTFNEQTRAVFLNQLAVADF